MWQALAAKAAQFIGEKAKSDPRWRNVICGVLVAIFIPVFLFLMVVFTSMSKMSTYNANAAKYLFASGAEPAGIPDNIKKYYSGMRGQLSKISAVWKIVVFGKEKMSDEDEENEENEDDEDNEEEDDSEDIPTYEWRTDLDERELLMKISYYMFYSSSDTEASDEELLSFATSFASKDSVSDIYDDLAGNLGMQMTGENKENVLKIWNQSYKDAIVRNDDATGLDWGTWSDGKIMMTYHFEGDIGDRVVQYALTRLGDPYDPLQRGKGNYVDCSYLTWWAYEQVGISIPTVEGPQAQAIYDAGGEITEDMLIPGDLIFWSYKPWYSFRSITHTGIYAGDGYVIHASYSKKQVVKVPIFDKDKIKMYGRPY